MTIATYKWTIDRYHQAIEAGIFDDQPVELLNGELIEMAPEGVFHAGHSSSAADYLRMLLGRRVKIREGNPITLSNQSEPEPDIAISSRYPQGVVQPIEQVYKTEHHPYPENIFWVIEYADSSLEKDTDVKRRTYAAAEICEYWVINLRAMALIVYRNPVNGDYQSQVTLTSGMIHPLSFPEVEVDVMRLIR
ncbi:Uma2 family endonuclease [Phormidesmis priestleyi]